jgi:hypothetical protein
VTSQRKPKPPAPAAAPDLWSIWFSRLMQIAGLGLVIYEATVEQVDRPWLLLVATAMMLGGLGLRLVVEWALKRLGGS